MRALTFSLTALSAVLIAAHFLRSGSYVLAVAGLLFPAMLAFRHRFAIVLVQAFLLLAGLEWLRTLAILALERQALGLPWMRMTAILGAVAAISVASALLLARAQRQKAP